MQSRPAAPAQSDEDFRRPEVLSQVPGARVLLLGILAIAVGLRVLGLGFGLPAVYNPDEIAILSRALAFAKGDLNPHNFLYPTFFFYVLFGWIGLSFVVGWLAGAVASVDEFQRQFFTDPTAIYLAARTLSVVCGVATVAVVHVLGRRLFGAHAGLAAALFLAVTPAHVRDAHYVKHDVPVTLAIVIAYLVISRFAIRDPQSTNRDHSAIHNPRFAIVAGLACGIAFATHYYAIFLVVPLLLALRYATREQGWGAWLRVSLTAFVAAAVTFFALSPFILVEPATAWNDIVANRQIVVDRASDAEGGPFASAGAYARMLWREAPGWPVLLAALVGVAALIRAQPRVAMLLLAFPAPFLGFISNTVAAGRYLNPVLPFVALFAGYAVGRVASRHRLPATIAAVALATPGFVQSATLGRFFRETDTRTLAQRFIEGRVPPESTVALQPYSVQLVQSRAGLKEALEAKLGDAGRASTKFALRLALNPYPAPAYRTIYLGDGGLDADKIYVRYRDLSGPDGLDPLERLGVRYVVLKRYNVEDPAVVPLRTLLMSRARLLASFSPYRPDVDAATRAQVAPFLHNTDTPYHPALERPGPGIEIWLVGS